MSVVYQEQCVGCKDVVLFGDTYSHKEYLETYACIHREFGDEIHGVKRRIESQSTATRPFGLRYCAAHKPSTKPRSFQSMPEPPGS